MPIDRKKFKASEDVISAAHNKAKSVQWSGDDRAGFLTIEDGVNTFRIFPAHSEKHSPYQGYKAATLLCEVDKWKDGEVVGKELKRKKIFCADLHSEALSALKKDPTVLYISYVEKLASSMKKDEKAEFLEPINGNFAVKPVKQGIKPTTEMVCYAKDSSGKFGNLSLKVSWLTAMKNASLAQTESDDIPRSDVFADADEGCLLKITKSKSDKNKTEYKVEAGSPKRGEDWDAYFERTRLSDADLEMLEKQKSLHERFVDTYSKRDWDMAIDGLRRFDEENGYGIFDDETFLVELEEMKDLVPDKKEKEDPKPEKKAKKEEIPAKKSLKKSKKEEEEISPVQMKKFLREYIEENYEDEELPKLSSEDLKAWYELAVNGEELPFESEEEEDEEDGDNGEEEEATESARDRIARLRGKR